MTAGILLKYLWNWDTYLQNAQEIASWNTDIWFRNWIEFNYWCITSYHLVKYYIQKWNHVEPKACQGGARQAWCTCANSGGSTPCCVFQMLSGRVPHPLTSVNERWITPSSCQCLATSLDIRLNPIIFWSVWGGLNSSDIGLYPRKSWLWASFNGALCSLENFILKIMDEVSAVRDCCWPVRWLILLAMPARDALSDTLWGTLDFFCGKQSQLLILLLFRSSAMLSNPPYI